MTPESSRQRFLQLLDAYRQDSGSIPLSAGESNGSLTDQIDPLLKSLRDLRDGDRKLQCEYNEEWDDWDDMGEDEFVFSDPDGVLSGIGRAFALLHSCLDQAEYIKGAELAKLLSELEVPVSGDFDEDTMDIDDLFDYDLLKVNGKQAVTEAVCLLCAGSEAQERAEVMLTAMERFGETSVSLEHIMRMIPEKLDLEAFLPSWFEALAKRSGSGTEQMLREALDMMRDESAVLELASRYAESHPTLYLSILRTGLENTAQEEMVRIGLRGMRETPPEHPVRSDIALLTAGYALKVQQIQIAEDCWMEAFRTLPTVVNYLRLRLRAGNWEHYAEAARLAYESYYAKKPSWNQRDLAVLLFFDERFEEMLTRFMAVEEGIGWSSTFMKEGIALLLMLLWEPQKGSAPGMAAMSTRAMSACDFHADAYCEGTGIDPAPSGTASFRECFQTWKKQVDIPEAVCEQWFGRIEKWVSLRVSAIMQANRRNYYDECAAFVAALGEAEESRGKAGRKGSLMRQYKTEYSRRRAFHEELRRFGMKE